MPEIPRKFIAALLVAPVALSFGCGEPDDAEQDPPQVDTVELIDRDDDEAFAYYHDGHWHHELELEADADEDDYVSVGFRFLGEEDEPLDVPLGEDGYDYEVEIDDDAHVWYDTHSDHFHIRGEEEGVTEAHFDFTLDGESFFDTHAEGLSIFVDDHDHENNHDHGELEVTEFELLDRNAGEEVIAYVDHDHWHDGEIILHAADDPDNYDTEPVADQGEAVSLGAHAEYEHDDHSHDVDFDDYDLEVHTTDEEYDDYLHLDNHGDHVHIVGVHGGHAHVVFQIVEDDEVVYETPEFDVDVHEHGH